MCGIIGYIGGRDASEILVNGLGQLEYRGYDSAGLVALDDGHLDLRQTVGRVNFLQLARERTGCAVPIGIAHTRWATHGRPNEANAHPHVDAARPDRPGP